jgi:hypothetical protein
LPETWTERPGDISECYFTRGRMFWMVTWFEWGWCWQQDVAEFLLLFAPSHDITSNACTLPKHTIMWYLSLRKIWTLYTATVFMINYCVYISYTSCIQSYIIQSVSGEIVNILGGGSMEYSE